VPSAIGFCPHPPLLVPSVAGGAAAELAGLRTACAEVVRRLLASSPERFLVLGAGDRTRQYPPGSAGSLARYGVPVTVALFGPPDPGRHADGDPAAPGGRPRRLHYASSDEELVPAGPTLPLPLTIGAWLLGDAEVPCTGWTVGPDPAGLAGLDDPATAVLVMGDGSACRSERAPGYIDPRATAYDGAVAAALRDGDAAALRDLDPALGAELLAAGVPAWRAVGALGGTWSGELLHDAAPYGVGYLAAVWT
jgi:hypothetical protein